MKTMYKTFTLQNMETYFNNYISCQEHKKEPITNFCTEGPCLKFLCPECIEVHSSMHANHAIQSIKTCIKKTSDKLRETISDIERETNRNSFLKSDNTEEYTKQLIKQLEQVKEGLILQIKAYFREKEAEIRKETSKYGDIQKKLQSLKRDLLQANAELKMLDKNLFIPQQTVKAITKANKLNFKGMVHHFHSRIDDIEDEINFNIKLQMNNEKRQLLRTNLNELIGIKNFSQFKKSNKSKEVKKSAKEEYIKHNRSPVKGISKYSDAQINPPPLSADRLLQQNSFRIEIKNYFEGEPFLHFFEVTNSTLHLIGINEIRESQPLNWKIIPLKINFKIPTFHRTISTQSGSIFIIGGTYLHNMKKSKEIYQYNPQNEALVEVANLLIPRSSHSVLCHQGLVYITGGMTDNEQTLKKAELFNPKTKEISFIAACKYATTNSCLAAIGMNKILKFGGVFSNGENNDTIQVYDISSNYWGEVDPTIQNVSGQFGLLSCSGWAPLNQTQIFIFGGYNEEADSENSRMSFVIQHNKLDNQFYIKYVNQKNPPIAEGFWNQQGFIHNRQVYCLQNVDGEEGSDCLEDKRNLLIFNGKTWSTGIIENQ